MLLLKLFVFFLGLLQATASVQSLINTLLRPGNTEQLDEDIECGYRNKRIVGGRKSVPESWPWMVSIQTVLGRHYCGGTLITARHVITAAHCIHLQNNFPFLVLVSLGSQDISKGTSIFVRRISIHPDFASNSTYDNDIAVLELYSDVNTNSEAFPACLPSTDFQIGSPDDMLTVIGWGRDKEIGENSSFLNEANVYLLADACTIYDEQWQDDEKMICAGRKDGGTDACRGDSGGPLLYRSKDDKYYIYGIVAFGKGCARKGYPGAYTRISNYVPWILEQVFPDSIF